MDRPLPSRDLEDAFGHLRFRNPWGDVVATNAARSIASRFMAPWDRLWKPARVRRIRTVFGHVSQALNRGAGTPKRGCLGAAKASQGLPAVQ
jgi:hypothetical protein